jgi:hypothetical protein
MLQVIPADALSDGDDLPEATLLDVDVIADAIGKAVHPFPFHAIGTLFSVPQILQ